MHVAVCLPGCVSVHVYGESARVTPRRRRRRVKQLNSSSVFVFRIEEGEVKKKLRVRALSLSTIVFKNENNCEFYGKKDNTLPLNIAHTQVVCTCAGSLYV